MDIPFLLQQLANGWILGSVYGLIAVGYTLVYGVLGMINFAHGDVFMISAYLTAITLALLTWLGIDVLVVQLSLALLVTVLITGLYGWAIERVAYRPIRGAPRLTALISAIGVSLALQNSVRLSQGARAQGVPMLLSGQWDLGPVSLSGVQLAILGLSILGMALLWLMVHRTRLGRALRAMQEDRLMAQCLGVPVDVIVPMVFVLGAMMAALAGFLVTLNYGSFDFFIGFIIGIKAFTAAVLGGIGSLTGALLGGILLGLCESLFSGFVDVDYKDVFAFSVLILVLIFRPSGLLGKPEIQKV